TVHFIRHAGVDDVPRPVRADGHVRAAAVTVTVTVTDIRVPVNIVVFIAVAGGDIVIDANPDANVHRPAHP
ncbi:MAG TPA: hypothetical protein PLK19_08795, partial [Mycobacterium sp.]|nr:hypothetical protein [Mycobacterium sp.]